MLPEIEQLLILQDRDQRIRRLQAELKKAPVERKELETHLAKANAGAEQARAKLKELEVRKNSFAGEAAAKREQIGRFKTQQMQTRKNEEYQALTNEIAHFEKEVGRIEDDQLGVMEQIDAMGPVVAAADSDAAAAREHVKKQISDLEQKVGILQGQLSELEAQREGDAAKVEEDLLMIYNRLFTMKNGTAVVPLEGETCSGCHMNLTTQTAVTVRGEKELTHCEQCGRILYLPR